MPPKYKSSSEQVHLVPDSCHREEGKSSCDFFEKVRINEVFFGISGFCVGLGVSNPRTSSPCESGVASCKAGKLWPSLTVWRSMMTLVSALAQTRAQGKVVMGHFGEIPKFTSLPRWLGRCPTPFMAKDDEYHCHMSVRLTWLRRLPFSSGTSKVLQ